MNKEAFIAGFVKQAHNDEVIKSIITKALNLDKKPGVKNTDYFQKDLNADASDIFDLYLGLENHFNTRMPEPQFNKFYDKFDKKDRTVQELIDHWNNPKLDNQRKAYTSFLTHFGPLKDPNNPKAWWYPGDPSRMPHINDIAEIYTKRKDKEGIKAPENFVAFVTNQGADFAKNWNKQHKLNYENGGMNEEMAKYRDLRHFTPKQWKAFKSHLNKTKYTEL